MSISCKSHSMHIWSGQIEAFSSKNSKKRSPSQISFGFQLQRFPWSCKARKFQTKSSNIDKRKSIQKTEATKPIKTVKQSKRETVTSFLLLCLNKSRAPGWSHVSISLNSSFIFSFLRLKTVFRHAQGQQLFVSLTGSINIIKTQLLQYTKWILKRQLTRNFGKRLIGFQK